jgi:hypothetical protein
MLGPSNAQLHGEADLDKIGASISQIAIDEAWTGRLRGCAHFGTSRVGAAARMRNAPIAWPDSFQCRAWITRMDVGRRFRVRHQALGRPALRPGRPFITE